MIQDFADWLVYGLFGLSADTPLGVAVNFFFYDTIKILILLFFISVLMGIINAYFPIERLRNYLVTHKMYGLQYVLASIFGAITPFCSCSSIPLFIGFVKGGIPLYPFRSDVCLPDYFSAGERGSGGYVPRLFWTESHTYLCHQRYSAGSDRRFCARSYASFTLPERLGEADTGQLLGAGRRVGERPYYFYQAPSCHCA